MCCSSPYCLSSAIPLSASGVSKIKHSSSLIRSGLTPLIKRACLTILSLVCEFIEKLNWQAKRTARTILRGSSLNRRVGFKLRITFRLRSSNPPAGSRSISLSGFHARELMVKSRQSKSLIKRWYLSFSVNKCFSLFSFTHLFIHLMVET